MAIVIVKGTDGNVYYYGPFKNGTVASHWAHANCNGFEWHWQDLINFTDEAGNFIVHE